MAIGLKGVILAGGTGSRLHPLTQITNKHLLPIYDRPMISWAIEALVNAGVTDLMLVTGGTHAGEFFRLLGNGQEYGIERLFYAYQERPGGIAEWDIQLRSCALWRRTRYRCRGVGNLDFRFRHGCRKRPGRTHRRWYIQRRDLRRSCELRWRCRGIRHF